MKAILISMRMLLATAVLLAVSGCFTEYHMRQDFLRGKRYVEDGSEIVEHYQSQNYGWYIFDTIPLVTGNVHGNHAGFMSFFHDYVRTDLMTERFNKHLRKTNTRPVAMATLNDDSVTFEVPGLSIAIPVVVPYVICYREVQISAILVKKGNKERQNEAGK